ncbi:hypothetical protein [Hydrogenophaga sp. PAMC20947]|uniref:hypothetical protein n=1 Tax=Hydrogenophaga sp. PAMC20947 TaxID=2565558 RepID=UPI00109D88F8|nr:hypothetical protein [Hydrogenophaga sp. PAMC20947]QCB46139.1 hypothetical protein E5678_08970 [Hydrogenophaga sp. PAMC20947]
MTGSDAFQPSGWKVPALALARWTALLMGWVWLGQQGQRLSWSLASGLVAVALWWTVRLLVAQRPGWRINSSRSSLLALGLVTAGGATALAQTQAGAPAIAGLLALAAVWGGWTAAMDHHSLATQRCQRPWAGWPPVLAALATWSAVGASATPSTQSLIAGGVLLGAAALAWMATPEHAPAASRPGTGRVLTSSLPATAMGCMMGSLWLSNAWCTSVGWSSHTVVGLHLGLMAIMPALVRMEGLPRHLPPMARQLLPLIGVAMGGGLLWSGQTLAHGLVGMLLLALSWSMPRQTEAPSPCQGWQPCAPFLGPVLLLAVGHWSPSTGPDALAWVYGLLAAWALVLALRCAQQGSAAPRQPTRPLH